jgi:hypothetical protein
MDDAELASKHTELFRWMALEEHFRRRGINLKSDVVQQYPGETPSDNGEGGSSTGPRGCIDCGRRIDPARLAVKPDAIRCIGCQMRHERHEEVNSR